jgi:hypothetical protein
LESFFAAFTYLTFKPHDYPNERPFPLNLENVRTFRQGCDSGGLLCRHFYRNPRETSTDKHNANDKTSPAERYVSAAPHGVRLFFVKVWTELHSSKFWIASTTVVIAVSTIVYTIYAGQWKEMRTQSNPLVSGGPDWSTSYDHFHSCCRNFAWIVTFGIGCPILNHGQFSGAPLVTFAAPWS